MFRQRTIGRKLAVMLIIPIAGLLFFAATGAVQRLHTQRETADIQELSQLAVAISAFVHEAQKERGITGVFMGSQGQKFRDELTAQRLTTDKRVTELNALLAHFEAARFGPKFQKDFDNARHNFYDKLGSHRTAVYALTMPSREGVGYYTQMNTAFLSVIAHISTVTSHAELSTTIAAYVNFLGAKEKTGIERATLASAFSRGKFESTVEFQRLATATATQDTLLSVFLSNATDEQQTFYRQKMQGQFVDEAARMRQIAFENLNKPDFGGIEATYWFTMMTGKINLMKEVEDKLTADLLTRVVLLSREARISLVLFMMIAVGSIGLTSVLAYGIARSITQPMAVAVRVAEGIAEGELHHTITVTSRDETGRLLQAMQTMRERLRQIVGDIQGAASNVSSAAREIVQGNSDLSQRTQEQAAALEETASSMEQMTSTVTQNADNARQANQLAASARAQAEEGGKVVSQAVAAMVDISSSSKKIVEIIGVIDGIAFQTNLLALNAAVEAARAGEHGHGFAVVAAEVRKLAQRSAEAAKEIKTLILESVDKVEGGTRLANASGKALGEIVTAVKKVSDIVVEITTASQEQSAGIEQVNKAVLQMDEMTQQNAALVEEAAAASESVETQARHLWQLMEFFKVDAHAQAPQPPMAAAALPDVAHPSVQHGQECMTRTATGRSVTAAKPSAIHQETVGQHVHGRQRIVVSPNGHSADSDWLEF